MHRSPFFSPKHIIGPEKKWQGKRFITLDAIHTYDSGERFTSGKGFVATGLLTRSRKGVQVWLVRRSGRDLVVDHSRTYWVRVANILDLKLVQKYLPSQRIKEQLKKLQLQFAPLTRSR